MKIDFDRRTVENDVPIEECHRSRGRRETRERGIKARERGIKKKGKRGKERGRETEGKKEKGEEKKESEKGKGEAKEPGKGGGLAPQMRFFFFFKVGKNAVWKIWQGFGTGRTSKHRIPTRGTPKEPPRRFSVFV